MTRKNFPGTFFLRRFHFWTPQPGRIRRTFFRFRNCAKSAKSGSQAARFFAVFSVAKSFCILRSLLVAFHAKTSFLDSKNANFHSLLVAFRGPSAGVPKIKENREISDFFVPASKTLPRRSKRLKIKEIRKILDFFVPTIFLSPPS